MSLRRQTKLLLATLIAIGGLGSLTVSGTYAILSAEGTNEGATVASGTLTLGNTVDDGTTCYSYGPGSTGNANPACSPLLSAATLQYPGSAAATAHVRIDDTGSADGGRLSVYMPSCTSSASPGAGAHALGGDPCVEIYDDQSNPAGPVLEVQETDASWTPTYCWYPVQAAGACADDPDYASFSGNSFAIVAEYAIDAPDALDLGSGPAHGQSRYFTIGVSLPTNASNSLQGQQATFDLAWHLST